MSLFSVQINFERSKLPQNFLHEIAKIIADAFNEPNENFGGSIVDKTNIVWEGSIEPVIFMTIQTVKNLDRDFNQKCTVNLTNFLSKTSKIPADRIIIYFIEKVHSDVAINGLQLHYHI